MPATSKTVLILPAALMATLLSGCIKPDASETERTMCRELWRDLPTYSRTDTAETLQSGARFVDVFRGICPEY